jgi:cytochrome P450
MIYWLVFLIVSFFYILFKERINEYFYGIRAKKHGCTPPFFLASFPFGLPAFIQLSKATRKNAGLDFFIDKYSYQPQKYTVRSQALLNTVTFTIDPENVKTILATNFRDYSLGVRHEQLKPLLGSGIFTLSGEGWRHSRALLRPQFSREQVSQLKTLNLHVQYLVNKLRSKSESGYFDCQVHFHELTLDTATEFLCGESTDSLLDSNTIIEGAQRGVGVTPAEFVEAFNRCLEVLSFRAQAGQLYWLVDNFKFRKNTQICKTFIDHFVYKALSSPTGLKGGSHIAEHERYIFINELVKETRDPIAIRDQCFNILLAGRDTTASLLSFALYWLAKEKRVWNKLREAVLEEYGTDASSLTFENLKRCQYLQFVINEVLRLNPAVPINFRVAVRDTILPRGGGQYESEPIFVPKGTVVFYSIHVMQRLEKFWGFDAMEFRPERWLDDTLHTWDFLPFNGGPRICLGQQFALTEASFTLVRILQEFKDVELDPRRAQDPQLHQTLKLTTNVGDGVPIKLISDEKRDNKCMEGTR